MPPHSNSNGFEPPPVVATAERHLHIGQFKEEQTNDELDASALLLFNSELSVSTTTLDGLNQETELRQRQHQRRRTFYCHHSHLPPWLQDNDYLQSKHRPPLNSYRKCLKSIFTVHSETGNIWSHLIGFQIYISLAVHFWTSASIEAEEKWVFSTFFIGCILCMGFSTLFHIFCCHSQRVGGFFIRLDYCGISILIMAGFYPWIYYGFYCETTLRAIYSILSLTTGTTCLIMSFTPIMSDPQSRTLRTTVFTSCGLVYLIPAIHFLILNGVDDPVAQRAFTWLMRVTGICIGKAAIYACRVPERWFPGRFDIWFQSHQIFHILVVVSTMVNFLGVRELSAYRMSQPQDFCTC